MSQPNQKNHKVKRQRANSQGGNGQKNDYGCVTNSSGLGIPRKTSKSQNTNHQSQATSFSGTRVYSNSNRTAELHGLLKQLPPQQSFLGTGNQVVVDNTKSGQCNDGANRRTNNSNSSSTVFQMSNHKRGYAGAVITGGRNSSSITMQQESSNAASVEVAGNDDESARLNSAALRRIDPSFSKLHGTASQVAVYRYNPTTQSWDKTDTVGCLFLYERNTSPKYGLVVMNRKNANNFIQCFGQDGQVVLNLPYLLLRAVEDINNDPSDGTQVIHCIWFYDVQDCTASANILRKMGLQFEGEGIGVSNSLAQPGQLSGNTLFQILQKKKEGGPAKNKPVAKVLTAEELESQMLHESESDRRIKRSSGFNPVETGIVYNNPLQPTRTVGSSSPEKVDETSTSSAHNPGGSVLQQFLNLSLTGKQNDNKGSPIIESVTPEMPPISHTGAVNHTLSSQNKMRTVEQLERDMKKDRFSNDSSSVSTTVIQSELMQTLGIPANASENQGRGSDIVTPSCMTKTCDRSVVDNIVGKTLDESDPEELRQALQNIEPSSHLILVTETIPGSTETRLTWRINRSSSVRKENDSTFTTPTGEFLSASGTRCSSHLGLGADAKCFDGSARPVDIKPTPLTKEQLHQALMYLIQHDPDFIKTIHDAYIKSLQQAYEVRPFK